MSNETTITHLCECGCGIKTAKNKKFISGHSSKVNNPNKNEYPIIPSLCQCGCNEVVWGRGKFINKHWIRVNNPNKKGLRVGIKYKRHEFTNLCQCGCGTKVRDDKRFVSGHAIRVNNHMKKQYPVIPSLCQCGCNTILWGDKKYVTGHNALTKEGREILSNAHKSKSPPNKGKPSPLKGRPGFIATDKTRKLWSMQRTGRPSPMRGKKTNKPAWNRGKTWSEETLKKLRTWGKVFTGEKAHNWRGGVSFLPYCRKFNNELKKQVRDRDNHVCQLCGKTEDRNGRKLDIHHIHYDKENCYPDLITICMICNHKVERKSMRGYYESLFMNKLNERGLLFWTRGFVDNIERYINYKPESNTKIQIPNNVKYYNICEV